MKYPTSLARKETLVNSREIPSNNESPPSFSEYIKEQRKGIPSSIGKNYLSTKELGEKIGVGYEQFRKIVNMTKPTKKRDCIIAICAALKLDSAETNKALTLYQYMPGLDTENPRDDLLIEILEEQFNNNLTTPEINQRLKLHGFPKLDIIDHRATNNSTVQEEPSPYKLLTKGLKTFLYDDLILRDRLDSLEMEYAIDRYRCMAEMWIEDNKSQTVYHLTADTNHKRELFKGKEKGNFSFVGYNQETEKDAPFNQYYLELERMANHELKKLRSILNDTKNYQTRISANIIDDSLHIFAESYNYTVPELNEYYLFEYKNGSPSFTIYKNSMFMYHYLMPDDYYRYYGDKKEQMIAQYKSVEELMADNGNTLTGNRIAQIRTHYYKSLQDLADALLADLKSQNKYIRHLNNVFDDRDRVCEFFGVENEFQCALAGEYGDIMVAKNDAAVFNNKDIGSIQITLKDLYDSFELGLHNIDEICRVKKRFGSILSILK